jgi:hypothetical protein
MNWIGARLSLATALTLACANTASAHPPYEHVAARLRSPTGREFQLVLSFVDGIIGTDPAKLVLRDTSGHVIAETDYLHSVIVRCPALESCRVFEYDPPGEIYPSRVWLVADSGFQPTEAPPHSLAGALMPVQEHWDELLICCLALSAVPLAAQFLLTRRRSPLVVVAWIVLGLVSFPWLFFWWMGTALNVPVATEFVIAGTLLLSTLPSIAVWRVLRRGLTTA